MIGLTFIGSGSKGNSALLELGESCFLLDVGFACRRITDFLAERNIDGSDLNGVFITHEHDDHVKGLRVLLNKYPQLPVYATNGTISGIKCKGVEIKNPIAINPGKNISVNGCDCVAFNVPHDANQPVGFRFSHNGDVMSVATDLGRVTPEVLEHSKGSDILCLESNYDSEMLRFCSYPSWLKDRIKGPNGHLPNEGVRGVLSKMDKPPAGLVLMHLSQESNTPDLARRSLVPFLENSKIDFRNTKIVVASQDFASERIFINQNP